jgi:hypothetical protein
MRIDRFALLDTIPLMAGIEIRESIMNILSTIIVSYSKHLVENDVGELVQVSRRFGGTNCL